MKLIIVALALVAVVIAAPPQEPWQILRSFFELKPEGSYSRSFETENGISQTEIGELRQGFDEEKKPYSVVVLRGSYTYMDNENQIHTVNYYADETGFHAESADIPTAPSHR